MANASFSSRTLRFGVASVLASLVVVACAGDEGGGRPATLASTGGAAGQAGSGASGAAGNVTAGAAGASAAGSGGAASGGKAGNAAGSAGSAGANAAGNAGAAGSTSTACTTAADCKGTLPTTTPANCAEWTCDVATKACKLQARDADGDGSRANQCLAGGGQVVALGDDCDDAANATHPGAWDGPAGQGKAASCDGVDQDCNGNADDGVLADGTSCTCTPGDTQPCNSDASGKPITFPVVDANGKPVGKCQRGSRICGKDGKFGVCTGIIPPDPFEICNGDIDDDCDGKADMEDSVPPTNTVDWTYDGDGDGYGDAKAPLKGKACQDKPPTSCASCDPSKWRLGNFPSKDCDDANEDAYPGAKELCNGLDDDCNGTVDDAYAVDAQLWYFDYDGDSHGDIDVPPVKSCDQPKTIPAECVKATTTDLPADFCAGVPSEGSPPVCPPPPCAATMWTKTVISNTDCKDHPGQGGVSKGNKPAAVHPGGGDLCNGLDYTCDGSATTGCTCAPLGSTQPCGSVDKCNDGSETCEAGGWGTCSGGPEKTRVDFCPDDDSDGFCRLDLCQSDLCPNAVPDALHKWKVRTACTGFTQPNGSDCDDADPQVNAGLSAEICNGDGRDHDCNGKKNTPGAGDCSCVVGTTQPCAPTGGLYPAGKKPGDPLAGECAWGTQSCTLGQWGLCTGGTSAQPAEICNGNGLDYDCNGKTNLVGQGDCGCSGAQTETCGVCGKGSRTCNGGQWGACVGDDVPVEYCDDADADSYCGTNCGQIKCPAAAGVGLRPKSQCLGTDCNDANGDIRPGVAEVCDYADNNCSGVVDEGFPVGTACNNALKGSCYKAGTQQCNGGGISCNAGTWADAPAGADKVALHGSFDRNCNGTIEYTACTNFCPTRTTPLPSGKTCAATGNDWKANCFAEVGVNGSGLINYACAGQGYDVTTMSAPSNLIWTTNFNTKNVPQCGSNVVQVACGCGATSSSCTFAASLQPITCR